MCVILLEEGEEEDWGGGHIDRKWPAEPQTALLFKEVSSHMHGTFFILLKVSMHIYIARNVSKTCGYQIGFHKIGRQIVKHDMKTLGGTHIFYSLLQPFIFCGNHPCHCHYYFHKAAHTIHLADTKVIF